MNRWRKTEKGKASMKLSMQKYLRSDKGKEMLAAIQVKTRQSKFWLTEKWKEHCRRYMKEYRQTDRGREIIRDRRHKEYVERILAGNLIRFSCFGDVLAAALSASG